MYGSTDLDRRLKDFRPALDPMRITVACQPATYGDHGNSEPIGVSTMAAFQHDYVFMPADGSEASLAMLANLAGDA